MSNEKLGLTAEDEERIDLVGALSAIEYTLLNPHDNMNFEYMAKQIGKARDFLTTPPLPEPPKGE